MTERKIEDSDGSTNNHVEYVVLKKGNTVRAEHRKRSELTKKENEKQE